jgi:flagellar basal body-associated protein FliL
MNKNLLKNSKQDLVDEIIKLRKSEEKLKEKIKNKDGKIKDLK